MEENLIHRYFDWICHVVGREDEDSKNLLWLLFRKDFNYILPMDENRESDGIDLRYRFATEADVPGPIISSYLDTGPCSVLEMMVALCLRCEETCMANEDFGDRTGEWFDEMIESLGLTLNMRPMEVDRILDIFIYREYEPNGRGGLFTIPNTSRDLRKVEIWYQATWWMDEKLGMW